MRQFLALLFSLFLHSLVLTSNDRPAVKSGAIVPSLPTKYLYATALNSGLDKKKFKQKKKVLSERNNLLPKIVHEKIDDVISSNAAAIKRNIEAGAQPPLLVSWRSWLENNVLYPERSRQLGEEGQVQIQLIFNPDGTLKTWQILRPSDFWRLNQAVERAMAQIPAHFLRPMPESEVYKGQQSFSMTLQFSVNAPNATAKKSIP